MECSEQPYPLPLPPGWVDRGVTRGARIAVGGPGLLLCTAGAGAAAPAVAAGDRDVLVLDTERVRCRGGIAAERTLVAVADEQGRSLTVEHWRYPPGHPVAEAVAVLPTGAYASLVDACTAALRGRRSGAAPAPMSTTAPRADLVVTVLEGRHAGPVGAGWTAAGPGWSCPAWTGRGTSPAPRCPAGWPAWSASGPARGRT